MRIVNVALLSSLAALLLCPATVVAQAPGGGSRVTKDRSDTAAVAAVVRGFHEALSRGDSLGALALLAPGATILESGGAESVAEYRGHHMPADIAFARAVPATRGPLEIATNGAVAWVTSTSVTQGTFRDRAVNTSGAELMVLERTAGGWRIVAIHWSSRRRQ